MPFMKRQVTTKQDWIEIDGTSGITALPCDVLSKHEIDVANSLSGDVDAASEDLQAHFGDYYEGNVELVSVRSGYGARLSAPGYLDCTEWSVFDTEAEAVAYLEEYYPDDDEED